MSHFSVIVIGANVEQQLQPYHEFECTGTNDEFIQDLDITEEVMSSMEGDDLQGALEYHGLEDSVVAAESEIDKDDDHKYGYAVVVNEKLIKAIKRTNPNKTWDWWVIGGRWSGFLKLKDGAEGSKGRKGLMGSCANGGDEFVDICAKKDIDFEGMRKQAEDRAAAEWDRAYAIHQGQKWQSWTDIRDNSVSIDAARETYRAQSAIQLMESNEEFARDHWSGYDDYLKTREEYILAARNGTGIPYAIVRDGKWFAKGTMGWWGISHDESNQDEWNKKVGELLDSLPDDELITVVDCHI